MNRPKDSPDNPATLARLSIRQEQARNKEAATLACSNARAQEREALNIFTRLPLARKLAALARAAPHDPAKPSRPPLPVHIEAFAQTIRQAVNVKNRKTENTRKDGDS